jgi:hypothetical protein
MKSIEKLAGHISRQCVAVKCGQLSWEDIEDERMQKIIALANASEVYYEKVIDFCWHVEVSAPFFKVDDIARYRHTLRSNDAGKAWYWFRTHPEAIHFVERAIEKHAESTDLAQFSFRLQRFILLALEAELDLVFQAVKDYILEVCQEEQ